DERNDNQDLGIDIFELLHERRHIGHELVIAVIEDELDAELFGAGAGAYADCRAKCTVFPQQSDAQLLEFFAQALRKLVLGEFNSGPAIAACGGTRPQKKVCSAPCDTI